MSSLPLSVPTSGASRDQVAWFSAQELSNIKGNLPLPTVQLFLGLHYDLIGLEHLVLCCWCCFGGCEASQEEVDCWVLCLSSRWTPLLLCLHCQQYSPCVSLPWWGTFPQTRSQDESPTLVLVLVDVCYSIEKWSTSGKHKQSLHKMKLRKPLGLFSCLQW